MWECVFLVRVCFPGMCAPGVCKCVPGVVQMPVVVSDVLCECVFLMCMSACSWCECECIPGVCECVFLVCASVCS